MNKILLFVLAYVFVVVGCAAHSIHVDPDGVQLLLKIDHADQVALACSIDRFTPREATRKNRDVWVVMIPEKKPFTYFYLVDGQIFLPDCPFKEKDDFGSTNCIYQPNL